MSVVGGGGGWMIRVWRIFKFLPGFKLQNTLKFASVTCCVFRICVFVSTIASSPITSAKCLCIGCVKTKEYISVIEGTAPAIVLQRFDSPTKLKMTEWETTVHIYRLHLKVALPR